MSSAREHPGQSPAPRGAELLDSDAAAAECSELTRLGCTNAAELVLLAGVSRCRQVRRWVQRNGRDVRDPAALLASRLMNGFRNATANKSAGAESRDA